MGAAVPQALHAYVYRNRLDALTRDLPVDANVVLGRVMAHEIGHLLLPPASHSRIGIMRPQMDLSGIDVDTFTAAQVQALRNRLAGAGASP